ncbi:MAG: hypothetical protein JW825_04390 [Candidatus Methanofastidiosa archaeon]|nr:hypothetical protein [Candidatus Methanofastidiosa archaeon]
MDTRVQISAVPPKLSVDTRDYMSIVEDFALRKLYIESRNMLEIDLLSANSFGRAQIKSDVDIDDLYTVIVPELMGLNILEQGVFDDILSDVIDDPRVRFGFSLACAKAAASFLGLPLYQYLGGIFNKVMPQIVLGGSLIDENFAELGRAGNLEYLRLDTLSSLSKMDRASCIKYVEEGSWHVAYGLSFKFVEIYKREDINEYLRIKEHMSEV